jgi:hypothetical protein
MLREECRVGRGRSAGRQPGEGSAAAMAVSVRGGSARCRATTTGASGARAPAGRRRRGLRRRCCIARCQYNGRCTVAQCRVARTAGGLTRAAVLDTAHACSPRTGSTLSIRALADGSRGPNALYSHVPGKGAGRRVAGRPASSSEPAPDAPGPGGGTRGADDVDITRCCSAGPGARSPRPTRRGRTPCGWGTMDACSSGWGGRRRGRVRPPGADPHAIGGAAFAGADGPVPAAWPFDFTRAPHWLLAGIAGGPPPQR